MYVCTYNLNESEIIFNSKMYTYYIIISNFLELFQVTIHIFADTSIL